MGKSNLGKSKEDYLEAIFVVIENKGACRMTDVAMELGYSRASVSVALKKLEDAGYVYRDDWRVLLTESGLEIAEKMYAKHTLLKSWFVSMGIEESVANEEACQIEHALSEETFCKITEYITKKTPELITIAK